MIRSGAQIRWVALMPYDEVSGAGVPAFYECGALDGRRACTAAERKLHWRPQALLTACGVTPITVHVPHAPHGPHVGHQRRPCPPGRAPQEGL